MAVDDNEVKEFEEKYKNKLFSVVKQMITEQARIIEQIHNLGTYVGIDEDIPNMGITLNNKLNELQREFQRAGTSMYSSRVEDYGPLELNFATSSFVGDSIIFHLIENATESIDYLIKYDKIISIVANRKLQEAKALKKMTKMDKFWAKIKSYFVPNKQERMEIYTEREKYMLDLYLSNYKSVDDEIWKYNLKDNIISSIVRKIKKGEFTVSNIPGLLQESVIPDLEKLGLADLIPQLQETLLADYKKDLDEIKSEKIEEDENSNDDYSL